MQALRHAADKATENLGRKDGATSGIGDKGTDAVLNGYTVGRVKQVTDHFPSALGADDFIARVEVALHSYGFTGHNSISCINLCRDEATAPLKTKIETVYGNSFSISGLGAILTCGVTGIKAGLSHTPIVGGKERYLFFSFPHIGIDAKGQVGNISRPGHPGASGACGALKALNAQFNQDGITSAVKPPGVHDYSDPELSILKQRLARRLQHEGCTEAAAKGLSLVDLTGVAERTITDDLEFLIKNAVDPSKADYAVVTGVQIHNYGLEFDDEEPNLEFLAPCHIYVVSNGTVTNINLNAIPPMTPRQISLLAGGNNTHGFCSAAGTHTTVHSVDATHAHATSKFRRHLRKQAENLAGKMKEVSMGGAGAKAPAWLTAMRSSSPFRPSTDTSVARDQPGAEPPLQPATPHPAQ